MTISFIGGGNMAKALIIGLLGDGTPATEVTMVEPDAGNVCNCSRNSAFTSATSLPQRHMPTISFWR